MAVELELTSAGVAQFKTPLLAIAFDDHPDGNSISDLDGTLGGALSYGQRKLLELAAVMMAQPELVLLDEPAGGVNPVLLERIADHIRQLNGQGVTFLLVEHNMGFVMNLCHEVVVLHQGRVIAQGKPPEVRENPAVLDAYLGA